MIAEFSKFAGFKVLNFFLMHPSTELHVQGLAKKLGINGATSAHYCSSLAKDSILNFKKQANLKLYSLNNNSALAKELKKTAALLFFKEKGIEKIINDCNSFAIYGSFADGTFDEKSDLDLIVIGKKESINAEELSKFEKLIPWEVSIIAMQYFELEAKKKKKDAFVLGIEKKHILLKGAEL